MEGEITIFEVMKYILLWMTPLVFLEGVILIILKADRYVKLEHYLTKERGGIKNILFPKIENNIYTLQNWLIKRTSLMGVFFIVYSIMIFLVLR